MSLEPIADILAGPEATRGWTQVVEDHVQAVREQISRRQAAHAFLEHTLVYHRDSSPDGCPHYRR
jgi:hypothetical protein